METEFLFRGLERHQWLCTVSEVYKSSVVPEYKQPVVMRFSDAAVDEILPFHIVSLSCLLHYLVLQNGTDVSISSEDARLEQYLRDSLRLDEYFLGKNTEIQREPGNSLGLWRVDDSHKDSYPYSVVSFLKLNYFPDNDLSYICESLQELYYNVFDHADAEGNSYSMICFNPESKKLQIAVCDMGVGIAKSVRGFDNTITSDCDAILKALEYGFTVRSTKRNRGYGLDNILSYAHCADVISGRGFVYIDEGKSTSEVLTYDFKGTLIDIEYDLSLLPTDTDILEDFVF